MNTDQSKHDFVAKQTEEARSSTRWWLSFVVFVLPTLLAVGFFIYVVMMVIQITQTSPI